MSPALMSTARHISIKLYTFKTSDNFYFTSTLCQGCTYPVCRIVYKEISTTSLSPHEEKHMELTITDKSNFSP